MILYITYDGLTDPLGRSQVLPYLLGLVNKGHKIHILSTEKKGNFKNEKEAIKKLISNKISWSYITYTKKPPILSTIKDIFSLIKESKKIIKTHDIKVIHCRSYITAFVGMRLKKKYGTKFIFDMRGFYADERVDGNIWDTNNYIFKQVFNFFKKSEKNFLSKADYTVSLTSKGKAILKAQYNNLITAPIETIPCCADIDFFSESNIDNALSEQITNKYKLKNKFVLGYLGSIGTWYMLKEMLDFFLILKRIKSNATFIFATKDDNTNIYSYAQSIGINKTDIIVEGFKREHVPTAISLFDTSIFFIKPVFSKQASSPTKLAELLSMGIPVICNSNVGDIEEYYEKFPFGHLIHHFNEESYFDACEKIDELKKISKLDLRNTAEKLFSLNSGLKKYDYIYKSLLNNDKPSYRN